jgi:hypothetical protein
MDQATTVDQTQDRVDAVTPSPPKGGFFIACDQQVFF